MRASTDTFPEGFKTLLKHLLPGTVQTSILRINLSDSARTPYSHTAANPNRRRFFSVCAADDDVCGCSAGKSGLSSRLIPRTPRRLSHHTSRQETGAAQRTPMQETEILRSTRHETLLQVPRTRRSLAHRRSYGLPVSYDLFTPPLPSRFSGNFLPTAKNFSADAYIAIF